MANTNVSATQLAPLGGAGNDGLRLVYIPSTAKAAQNDTITIVNCTTVVFADLQIVASGAQEANTISGNVITLTSATATPVSGILLVK